MIYYWTKSLKKLTSDFYNRFNYFYSNITVEKRMKKLEELKDSSELEKMTSSQVHKMFGIKRFSNEF